MAKIDNLINKVTKDIIDLQARNHINVTMRIDETLKILGDTNILANAIKNDQKFDLVQTVGDHANIVYTVNGEVIQAGANVLSYGDDLTITVTTDAGYELETFKINNVTVTSPYQTLVTDNLNVVVSAVAGTYALTETKGTHTTLTYSVGGETITAGSQALTGGTTLTITAGADTGFDLTTFTVNGVTVTSPYEMTVTGAVEVVTEATLQTFNLAETVGENVTVTYTVEQQEVTAGTGVLSYGDVLTITATPADGYAVSTLTVNGETFTSGNTITVTGNITVVAEATTVI